MDRTQKEAITQTIKDRLLADIPALRDARECLQWGLTMSDTFETLSNVDKEVVREALMARQASVMNDAGQHV